MPRTVPYLLILALPALAAAQVPRNRALYPNEQWVQLFNGKDLTNWVEVGHEKWTVEDGTIHGQGVTIGPVDTRCSKAAVKRGDHLLHESPASHDRANEE